MNSEWQKEFFSKKIITDFWTAAVSPEQTELEASFLASIFPAKGRVLDIPCGNGRIAHALAAKGFSVCGVDISENYILQAREDAEKASLNASFILSDMREITFENEFDGAFCFGNSFGYFEYGHLQRFVQAVARALKADAPFVINTGMTAESILPNLHDREWFDFAGYLFLIENKYLVTESCLETEATIMHQDHREKAKWWHWVYTVAELKRLLEGNGFRIVSLFGDMSRQAYKFKDRELFIVAAKGKK